MNSYTAENNQVPEMQQNLELFKNVHLFASFPGKALKLLAFLAARVRLAAGDVLFEGGDDHGEGYLILTGQLNLTRQYGEDKIVLQRYAPGDFLGFFSLLGAMPALFTLQAETETTLLTINRKQFSKILEQFPETTKLSLKALLNELHQWERKNIHEAGACCLSRTGVTVL